MVNTRRQTEQNPLADAVQTIPAMLGGRVRKRRAPSSSILPSKRAKTSHARELPPKAQVASYVTELPADEVNNASAVSSAPPKVNKVPNRPAKSQRQLRLSEMLKRDRQQRFECRAPVPTIIRAAPHMDSRRPSQLNLAPDSAEKRSVDDSYSAPSTPKRPRDESSDEQLISLLSSPVTRHPPTPIKVAAQIPIDRTKTERVADSFVTSSSLASNRVRSSGCEAIAYSRALLPTSHALLLDIFSGIETAVNLLRTRREFCTFSAVRNIVGKSSKRDFTFRHLSQLAHLVPEALSVLPSRNSRLTGRDHLLLRLDSVGKEVSVKGSNGSITSFVGGAATRARRGLLHVRLLDHVRGHHLSFLKKLSITAFESNFWHQDFDLETDVPEVGAPPLYPVPLPKAEPERRRETPKAPPKPEQPLPTEKTTTAVEKVEVSEAKKEKVESCIPAGLLERVRARSRARSEIVAAKEVDYRTKPEYLSRLPATMDTIASILRADKRQAFGWTSLVTRLVKQHPRQWDAAEIERQLDSIVEHASEWCSKVTLSGPKLRYAFRIVDERKFAAQRSKVLKSRSNV